MIFSPPLEHLAVLPCETQMFKQHCNCSTTPW